MMAAFLKREKQRISSGEIVGEYWKKGTDLKTEG